MKKIGFIIFLLALVVGVIIAKFTSFGSQSIPKPFSFTLGSKVVGSGNSIEESRNTGEFSGIKVAGIFRVKYEQSSETSVVVKGDDNILPHIKTEVRDGVLKIYSDKRFKTRKGVIVSVSSPNLEKLYVSGVARVTASKLDTANLAVKSSGASKLELNGKVEKLNVRMSGATRIKGSSLKVNTAEIRGSGAASARVDVSGSLKAKVSGASSVRYVGKPSVIEKSVSGAGSVKQAD